MEERAGVAGREYWLGGAGVGGADASCAPGMLRAGDGGGRPEGAAAEGSTSVMAGSANPCLRQS